MSKPNLTSKSVLTLVVGVLVAFVLFVSVFKTYSSEGLLDDQSATNREISASKISAELKDYPLVSVVAPVILYFIKD